MEHSLSKVTEDELSPYRVFTEAEWARLRADTPMTLRAEEVRRLQSLNDPVSIGQVESILLPRVRFDWTLAAAFVALPVVTALIAMATARRTVMRALARLP